MWSLFNRHSAAATIAKAMLCVALLAIAAPAFAQSDAAGAPSAQSAAAAGPSAPASVDAFDRPWDGGRTIRVRWSPSGDAAVYHIYRALLPNEIKRAQRDLRVAAVKLAQEKAEAALADSGLPATEIRDRGLMAASAVAAELLAADAARPEGDVWRLIDVVPAGTPYVDVQELKDGEPYRFRVVAVDAAGNQSAPTDTTEAAVSSRQLFDGTRLWLLIITTTICGSVLAFIAAARQGLPLKVRQIAGLAAVDEAVGRATEMGRSVIFIPGIQDMNDIQTVAGITVLARVAQTAAEYDARVEVPTARSLVMTAARETVQASFLSAGRPEAFNPDLIYYVTDEQFGFVAYLSGMMVREKPAACFYMGSFFAESLILAETGNSIGAIQIAGTAQPAQLPFFVAACDYTLIGEEFFAASAYLSGEPDQLGSLKGQDIGKIIVAVLIVLGSLLLTIATLTENPTLHAIVQYIQNTMLG